MLLSRCCPLFPFLFTLFFLLYLVDHPGSAQDQTEMPLFGGTIVEEREVVCRRQYESRWSDKKRVSRKYKRKLALIPLWFALPEHSCQLASYLLSIVCKQQKAKAHKASVRCIFFDLSRERCEHNAKFRAWGSDLSEVSFIQQKWQAKVEWHSQFSYEADRLTLFRLSFPPQPSLPLIPGIAFSSFYSSLEQPPISETGEEEAKLGYGDRTIRVGWRWEDQDEKDEMGQLSQRDREKRARYLRWYGWRWSSIFQIF